MEQQSPLKIYFLPFPSPGHMNPMVNLAQIFATRGEEITIITTPSNTKHIPKHFHNNIHTLNFPSNQLNLPPNLENLSSAKDPETAHKIYIATHLLIPQIETFLKQNPPSVFIPDIMFSHDFSYLDETGITVLPFNPMSIFVACIVEAINKNNNSSASFNLLGDDFPQAITLPVNPSYGFDTLARPFLQAKHNGKKHGIIVNSFAELEEEYIEYYEKLTGVKVWHVGISSLMVELECHDHEIKSNGYGYPPHSRSNGEAGLQSHWTKPDSNGNDDDDDDDDESLSWLNSKEPKSVVYICFGSLCRLNKEQYLEIANGLEGSGYEFLWVVPEDDEEFCVPKEGFKRGKVVRGWAPQRLILKHRAIGGFLTHCGWNSVAEAICAGVPMITMPRFSDQFFNERLVTEVHGIGVEVGAWEWSLSPFGARKKVVSKEQIEKAVRKVMKGSLIRKQAKELQEIACKAVQQGGSSYHHLTTLVQSLKQINLDGMLQAN